MRWGQLKTENDRPFIRMVLEEVRRVCQCVCLGRKGEEADGIRGFYRLAC